MSKTQDNNSINNIDLLIDLISKNSNINEIIALLERDPTIINAQDKYGNTAFGVASRNIINDYHDLKYTNNIALLNLLISSGADVDQTIHRDGFTLILRASALDKTDLVRLLLNSNADINKADNDGETPFSEAAIRSNIPMMQLLVNNGANLNAATFEHGYTPLMQATKDNNIEVVQFLINNHADLNVQDNYGWTALYHCTRNLGFDFGRSTSTDIFELLLNNGADTHIADKDGWAPLHTAIAHGREDLATLTIKTGNNVDVNAKSTDGRTPLSLIVHQGGDMDLRGRDENLDPTAALAKLLLKSGGDITMVPRYQDLPMLHNFCKIQQAEAINDLLYNNKHIFQYGATELANAGAEFLSDFLWQKLPIELLKFTSEYVDIVDLNRVHSVTELAIEISGHDATAPDDAI